jgi:hypothetical protein
MLELGKKTLNYLDADFLSENEIIPTVSEKEISGKHQEE